MPDLQFNCKDRIVIHNIGGLSDEVSNTKSKKCMCKS